MRTVRKYSLRDGLTLARRDLGWVSQRQLDVANRLAEITEHDGTLTLRRRPRMVGLARLGSAIVEVEPDIPMRTFLGLVYLFKDIPLEEIGGIDIARDEPASELFRGALAMGLIRAVETVSRRHIDQSYEIYRERLQLLRGRPLWRKEFGRVRDGSVECEFALKTTDGLLNRLLLAGLLEARRCMPVDQPRSTLRRQLATWEGLATPTVMIDRHDFSTAFRCVTRQTRAYAPALRLCEALLFGVGDPHDRLEGHIALPVYDLAPMFEKLVQKLVVAVADDCGLHVLTQKIEDQVLRDGEGNEYRRFRPDAVIMRKDKPAAVIDAKYKPRYTRRYSERSHRVASDDIYQIFFYADRLRQRSRLKDPIPAYVAAPHLMGDSPMPSLQERTIYWEDKVEGKSGSLIVVPIPVVPIIDSFLQGDRWSDAAVHAKELLDAVRSLRKRRLPDWPTDDEKARS